MSWVNIIISLLSGLVGGSITKDLAIYFIEKKIDVKNEKLIEEYKSELSIEIAEIEKKLDNRAYITKTQYDKEMKIYSDVWKTLSKLTNYLQSIDELNESDNTINDFNSLKEKRSKSCNELKEEKDGLKNLIDSNEPFLPENIYNVLNEIVSEAQKIFEICFKYVEIKKNASTKDFEKLKMHRNEIENKKKTLVKEIRKYINSLKLEVNT